MWKLLSRSLLAASLYLGWSFGTAMAHARVAQAQEPVVDFIRIDADITLRRMVVRSRDAKGVILFLHGFPETLYTWRDMSLSLADDYEVHAFDWPGYGLSSRPPAEAFSYAPRDYARVLRAYIREAGVDTSKLTIYATDIGALPVLMAAIEEPAIARRIIVGDFAPFDRPGYMYASLQSLKSPGPAADATRAALNANRDEIIANTFSRGLNEGSRVSISSGFSEDMLRGWNQGGMTSADAFAHYYSSFTRDQHWLEANITRLETPVAVIWGEKDLYINSEMGVEFARRAGAPMTLLPDIGHYPHLQDPELVLEQVRASFD